MKQAIVSSAIGIAMVSASLSAQAGPPVAERIAAIKQSIAENQMAMRKYQWLQTTKVALNGEVKQQQVASCGYQGAAPKPVCTEISSTPSEKPSGGPVRKKMMENKIAEMKAYMDSVKTLMAMYVPLEGAKLEAAAQTGNVSFSKNPMAGTLTAVVSNYVQQGDKVTLIANDTTKKVRSLAVSTFLGDPSKVVALRVTMAALPDGTRYPAQKILDATAQGITVTVASTTFTMAVSQ